MKKNKKMKVEELERAVWFLLIALGCMIFVTSICVTSGIIANNARGWRCELPEDENTHKIKSDLQKDAISGDVIREDLIREKNWK